MTDTCALCDGPAADAELGRTLVWEDDLWRLSMSVRGHNTVAGFSFLEPKRHIPHITDLDGEEARTFGTAIARCTAVLKEATGAELVFVYVFGGGIPHLHAPGAAHHGRLAQHGADQGRVRLAAAAVRGHRDD